MTEWEQIKKEYREIPVPADGPHQMLKAIAEAKQKRNRFKNLAKYSTVAAAALLVLLIPGMVLFSGGFGAKNENAFMEADCAVESTKNSGGWLAKDDSASNVDRAPVTTDNALKPECADDGDGRVSEEKPTYSANGTCGEPDNMMADAAPEAGGNKTMSLTSEQREAISREILRQMEERMQNIGETYYIKCEKYPNGFEKIDEEQEHYINEEGLMVIVFEAGIVAPKAQGVVEFIIPAEVFSTLE